MSASLSIAARTDLASIIPPSLLLEFVADEVLVEEEEGRVAKAERAALKAGVSVRRWRARFTLSERTLVLMVAGVYIIVSNLITM